MEPRIVDIQFTHSIYEDTHVVVHGPSSDRLLTYERGNKAVVLYKGGRVEQCDSRALETIKHFTKHAHVLCSFLNNEVRWPEQMPALEGW